MRIKNIYLCALLAAAFLFCIVTATAEAPYQSIDQYVFVVCNDEAVEFNDAVPEIRDGTTYVPVRFFAQSLGAKVAWDEDTQTATLTRAETVILINRAEGTVSAGGETRAFDMFTKNDRIMVPYRFIAESFGYTVTYIEKGNIARVKNAQAKLSDDEIYEKYIDEILQEKKEIAKSIGNQDEINLVFSQIADREQEKKDQEAKKEYERLLAKKAEIDEKYKDIPADKIVYITMDDGPNIKTTKEVLDTFFIYDMKVTFFLKGNQIKYLPDQVKRMATDGHAIGLHSMTHNKELSFKTDTTLVEEFKQENDILEPIIGYRTMLARIPFGSSNLTDAHYENLIRAGYKIWDFNLDTGDWAKTMETKGEVLDAIKNNLPKFKSGEAVILLHDIEPTLAILPEILEYLRENGYRSEALTTDLQPINSRSSNKVPQKIINE